MHRSLLLAAVLATLSLTACDRPTVVTVPTPSPGPAGPTGATGATGDTGSTGSTGKPGEGTTVIVVPPAASAPN